MRWLSVMAALGVAMFVFGCASGRSPAAPGGETAGQTAPPSHYRSALLADAMRGLRYDSGRVEIDHAVADTIARRGTRAEALAEYERGRELLQRNQRILAIKAHTRAVLIAPDEPLVYEGLAAALLAKGKVAEAVAAWRTALDLDPERLEARLHLAEALQRQRRFAGAAATFRQVLKQDPQCAAAHARLAVVLYYLGDDAGAWQHVHRAEALGAPVPPQFRALLARRTPEPPAD